MISRDDALTNLNALLMMEDDPRLNREEFDRLYTENTEYLRAHEPSLADHYQNMRLHQ